MLSDARARRFPAFLLLLLAGFQAAAQERRPYNIVLIMADMARIGHPDS